MKFCYHVGIRIVCTATIVLTSSIRMFAQNTTAYNESEETDSTRQSDHRFNCKQLILPTSLIAIGSFGLSDGAFHKFNHSVRDFAADIRGRHYFRADDYIQYLPVISYVGLGAAGVDCRHSIKERIAAGATAYIAMGIMVNAVKFTVNEKRPDSNAMNSFPSGHTATAFMGAELVRQEYGPVVSIGAYTVATSVGLLRIYNDRHWLNDVLAGAGIGILSARIGYWMLPVYRKWFKWSNTATIAMLPSYDFHTQSIGIGFAASF